MNVVGTSYFDTWANYQVGYDLISQSVENNTSTVRFYGVLNVTGNNISWSWATASVWTKSNGIGTYYGRGSHVVVQQDITITHNADGNYSGTLSGTLSSSYKGGTASGTFSLPKIDRIAVVSAVSDFNDETNPTITFTNPAGFNINAFMSVNGTDIATDTHIPSTGTYTFNLTEAQRNQLRQLCTGQTLSVRVGLRTEDSGGSILGSSYKDKTMTLLNANPTFTATYEDTNATTLAITQDNQQIIRNNSTLVINISNAQAKKYATLTSLKAEINGATFFGTLNGTTGTINIGTLNLSSNIEALVTLVDSRGLGTGIPLTLEILDWQLPTAIVNLARQNNFYSETDINVDANYSSLDGKNTITIKARSKKITDSSYGAYTDLQDSVTSVLQLDNNYQWDVQVLVQDKIGSTTYNFTIDRGIPIVFFDRIKRSMGINCFPENDTSLEVNNTIRVLGDLIVDDGNSPVNILQAILGNSMEIIEDNNKTSIKFANGLLINTIVHAYSNIAVSTQWGGIYASATHQTDSYLTPFTTLFSVNMNAKPAGGNHWMMETEDAVTPTTTAPSVQFLRGASGTATGSIMIIAIGKWN